MVAGYAVDHALLQTISIYVGSRVQGGTWLICSAGAASCGCASDQTSGIIVSCANIFWLLGIVKHTCGYAEPGLAMDDGAADPTLLNLIK